MKKKWSFFRDSLDYKPDWKTMSFSGKIGYVWDYYKLPIVLVLIVLYIIGYIGYRHAVRKEPVLYVNGINIVTGDDLKDVFTNGYKKAAGLSHRQEVVYYDGMFLTDDTTNPYFAESQATQIKVTASIAAQQLDMVLMNQEAFDAFSQNGDLLALDTVPDSLTVQLSQSFVSNIIILEDNATEAMLDPEVEYQAVTEEHPYGIDLSQTALFGPDNFQEPVYLGIIVNTPRLEEALSWVEYLSEAKMRKNVVL